MKFLTILFLGLFSYAYSQTIITQPYLFQQYITVKDSANISGRLIIPIDTTTNKLGIAQIGSNIYAGNGVYWKLQGSGGSTGKDTTAWHIGGDSTTKQAILGTKTNGSLYFMTNNIPAWRIDSNYTFGVSNTGFSSYNTWFDISGDGYFSQSLQAGAVYPSSYLSLPDTNRNVAYGLIGSHNGSLFAQIGTGQYFRQILMAKDSGLYTTPTQSALKLNKSDSALRTGYVTPTVLTNDSLTLATAINGKGTVTSVATTNGLGISSSVTNSSTTPNITIAVDTSNASILSRQRAAATYTTLTSLSATRNVSTGSIFTYNSATGAYNFDTTKLNTYTAGSNITIASNVVSADTTTGATKLATQGYVSRNSTNLSANAPISIVSNTIKLDTITRFTGSATLGKAYNDSLVLAAAIAAKTISITYDTLTDGSTITWNVASNQYRSATLTLAGTGRTLTITNPATNGFYTLRVKQDGTGNRTITTFPSTTYWSYGSAPPVTLTGEAANQVDIISFWYTGSSTYYGTFNINFK